MSAWILPDHIADVLPCEARHIEELRRNLLDTARCFGYELVMPPLMEHLESLLTGSGVALDLQTFKLVDQLSGRMMGLRADSTPQVARIDAHLLNRSGVTRLCYCGPVLHTRAGSPQATREPLQLGAEIYGHAGLEADVEVLTLSLCCLKAANVSSFSVDLADARLVKALLAGVHFNAERLAALHSALAAKDTAELISLTRQLPDQVRQGLLALVQLYGDERVLDEAEKALQPLPDVHTALQNLKHIAQQLHGVKVSFDLADLHGYAYYTGVRFAIYAPKACDALVRGGRYDEVGAVFGRSRPAAGFSLDLKTLASLVDSPPMQNAIVAPWQGNDAALNAAIATLRLDGEIVVCVLPGQSGSVEGFFCDRELIEVAGQWVVQAID